MKIEPIKRWQWIAVSVALGLLLAWARRADQRALLAGAGRIVTDQRWFEREVRRQVLLADGRTVQAFQGLRVYPAWIDQGDGLRRVDLVSGMYLAETDVDPATGQVTGRLRRYTYVAPVPYRPMDAPAISPARSDTVAAYLDRSEVRYVHAWWADPRYASLLWVGGSVVAVGLIWPTLINLLVYGQWRRPAEEKGVDLGAVAHSLPTHCATPEVTSAELEWMAGSEAGLTSPGPSGDVGGAAHAPVPQPVRPLPGVPLDTPEPVAGADTKEFGAAAEDFYPTELRARPVGASVPSRDKNVPGSGL